MATSQRKIIRFWWNLMYSGTFGTRWQPDDQIWTFLNSRWRTTAILTSSSAVTKRPRDAWYLSVVSVIASIVQYLERSFFIKLISYFDFKFTSRYNSIVFCCLRRNVEPCCHTHDTRTTMNMYSARPRLVGIALYTDNRDCVQRVALGRPILAD